MLPMSAPKSKLPYIEDGEQVLGDSGFIALSLKEKWTTWISFDACRESSCQAVQVILPFVWQATGHIATQHSGKKGGLTDGSLAAEGST